jgi:hypothetical protein
MADRQNPLHPLVAAGVLALLAGCVAWAWLGEWRWAVTGLGVLVVSAVVAAVRENGQP